MAGAIIGAVVSEAFTAAVGDAVLWAVVDSGLAMGAELAVSSVITGGMGMVAGGLARGLISGGNEAGSGPQSVSAGAAQGMLINVASNVAALPVIYGQRKIGGSRVLIEVTGSSNEYLHIVIALCEGEIDSVPQIYLDDTAITDARFSGLVTSETYVGTDNQAASAALIAALPGKWTSAHQGCGVAYLYLRLKYDRNAFSGLPTITADVKGRKLYDPRSGLTVWSNTPPLAIRDYLSNTRYGRGLPSAMLGDFSTPATYCEGTVSTPAGSQARYTCDGAVDIDQTLFDNIQALLTSCRAWLVWSAGVYKLVIDKDEQVTLLTVSATDKASALSVAGNTVTGSGSGVWQSGRATKGFAAGRWYWEVTIGALPVATLDALMIGVANASMAMTSGSFVGIDANSWGFLAYPFGASGGNTYHSASNVPYAASPVVGDVVGVYLDMDAGRLGFTKNGVDLGIAYTGLSGTLYPAHSCYAATDSMTFNYGATSFRYAPPSGYIPAYGFQFTEDNITGDWTISLPGRRDRYNRVTAGIYNGAENWQPDLPIADSPAYRAQDNNLLLEAKIDLPFTADFYRGQQIAGMELKRSRFGIVANFSALQEGLRCEVGDVVAITHTTPGWVSKLFRVMNIEIKGDDEVDVVVREYDASAYVLDTLTAITGTAASNLPNIFSVVAPGAPTVTESLYSTTGSAGVKSAAIVTWSAVADQFVVGYLPEYKLSSDSTWISLGLVTAPSVTLEDLAPALYDFRVRSQNSIGKTSAYSPTVTKELLGLTAPPAAVSGFTVAASNGVALARWTLAPDLDVRIGGRIVIRWTPLAAGVQWENGIDVGEFNGDAVAGLLPMLTGTYLAKAKDSTANWSTTAASFVLTSASLTSLPNSLTLTEHPAFAGAKSNVAAVDSQIKLDSISLVDSMGLVDSWGYIDSIGGVVASGTYDFSAPMDFGSVVTRRITTNVQALAFDTGDLVDSRGMVDDWDSVDGATVNDATAQILAALSNDAVSYGSWFPLPAGDVTCRAIKFRLALATTMPTHNIGISQLSATANW